LLLALLQLFLSHLIALGNFFLATSKLLCTPLFTFLELFRAPITAEFSELGFAIRAELHVDVNFLLVRRRVRFKRGDESIVAIKGANPIQVGVLLDVINITPTSSNSFLKILESLVKIVAQESFNTSKIVERSYAMERAGGRLLLKKVTSLLETLTSLSLHKFHGFLVKSKPLLAALPRVRSILGLAAIDVKIVRALSAVIRSTATS
jgi:hypothetical protein